VIEEFRDFDKLG
jgi:hypothetical protein